MKISLITLVTLFTLTAWGLGLSQMPPDLRIPVIAGSLITLFLLVAISAFNSRSKDGKLDVDNNELFKVLEPAFKIASSVLILTAIGLLLLVGFLLFPYIVKLMPGM